jgi:hypothetical protein
MIRKSLSAIGRNKSVGLDGICMVTGHNNNATIPSDWKRARVVSIYKGGDQLIVTNYKPVSLTSVICKLMEYVIADT